MASERSRSELTSRRSFFMRLGALSGMLACEPILLEPNWIVVERHRIQARGPHASGSLVLISDLHTSGLGVREKLAGRIIRSLDPDIIAILGDSVESETALPILSEFLALLPRRASKFAVPGNWEHWGPVSMSALSECYRSEGVTLLVNESQELHHRGHRIIVTGVDDYTAGSPNLLAAINGVSPGEFHILLTHTPLYRDYLIREHAGEIDRFGFEYMFAGHSHGGQVNFFGFRPFLPLGTGRYVEGCFEDAEPRLYVSRGVGTSVLPIRFNSPPEITYVSW